MFVIDCLSAPHLHKQFLELTKSFLLRVIFLFIFIVFLYIYSLLRHIYKDEDLGCNSSSFLLILSY